MRPLLTLALLALAAPAFADDEGSEHTAQVVGEPADTLGVAVSFDARKGWIMKVRAKPGAKQRAVVLTDLGKGHGHFHVYVGPGRAHVTVVETFIGLDRGRSGVSASDPFARTYSPGGKLVRTVTYGQVFKPAELAKFQRSVSHQSWMDSANVTRRGLELGVAGAKRAILVDAKSGAVR